MIDKFGGYKTQIRVLEKKLKEMDHSKLNPAKVKELTEAIQNLKNIVKEKEDKREERRKKKEEAAKVAPAKAEATIQTPEVVKESLTTPTEVTKESTVEKFAIDSKVEPIRGTPGSWGVVIREAGVNNDPLCYVKWMEGTLKEAHGDFGAYYPSDLRLKAEVAVEAKDPTQYVPREQLYNLEADLKSNYEQMIADLQEEIKLAYDKGEAPWAKRLEDKLANIQKAYGERFSEKTASKCSDESGTGHAGPMVEVHHGTETPTMYCEKHLPTEKTAEDENGSGGSTRLKVVDLNPPYDKDPQEKATGYGGDRPMGAMVAPNSDENSLPLESSKECYLEGCKGTIHKKEDGTEVCDTCHGEWGRYAHKEASLKIAEKTMKVKYHSKEWNDLVETGWTTWTVEDDGMALMKHASLKFADLDLESIDKRWALYIDGKLAIRTLTRQKAERIAKERFPEQVASGKYEIKREDHTPVTASLDKQAIHITVAEKLFVVSPLQKTADNEYVYDVSLADNSKLFKITSKDEMGQEHLAYVIEKELLNHKEAKQSKLAKLTSNLAFLKKNAIVSILTEDKVKGQVKFASLDGSLRGWAPANKFAAFGDIEQKFMDHEGHKDEVFAESGNELLVSCPAGTTNITWRIVEAPPATPESLNDPESFWPHNASLKKADEEIPQEDQPDYENDIFVDSGREGTIAWNAQKPIAKLQNDDYDTFYTEIKNWMEANSWFPTVWSVSDHGNVYPSDNFIDWMNQNQFKTSSLNKEAHIRHEDGKWVIYSHDYKKKLGTYDSKEAAEKRLKQIEYFKHQGSLKPLSKKEARKETKCVKCDKQLPVENMVENVHGAGYLCKEDAKEWNKDASLKRADWQEMEESKGNPNDERMCGEPRSTKDTDKCPDLKRHDYFRNKKKADQEVSLEQQVQGFRDRMNAVTERLANPPAKTADLETTQDLSKVDVKDLSEGILHMIDLLESKVGTDVSADPELHPMLENLENKVYEIEMKLGIKPELPEHERLEPEHQEVLKEVGEEPVEKESDMSNVPPPTPAPQGFRYAWEPVNKEWIMVADPNATGTGTGGTY